MRKARIEELERRRKNGTLFGYGGKKTYAPDPKPTKKPKKDKRR